ncbi:MAG TPA: MFS transporter [Steroidobacter sp.]
MQQSAHKNYLLGVLTVILIFNLLDRVALGLVIQSIKADLDLSDTQIGFLSGIAFALFYSVMGVPIARWADRGNRVTIISITTALWSVAVAMCGMATSFLQLLLIRVGVAVGEAGCNPPAFSLIADYFDRAERPRAAALYGIGAPLSSVIGFFLAGWLNELYGWRMTFVLLGAPGVALALLAHFTLKEPRLTAPKLETKDASQSSHTEPSMREVCVTLWRNVTFRHLLLCLSVMFFFLYGIFVWLPAFFMRSFGLGTGELGTWLALTFGLGGVIGAYLGGTLASRYAAGNERLQLSAMAVTVSGAGVLSVCTYLATNHYLAFALVAVSTMALTTVNGPLFSTIQTLVPERMRAVAFAFLYLFANLIGMGLGPLAAGALSDALHSWAGDESLRYALLILGPGYFISAWHAWRASRTVTGDLAGVQVAHHQASRVSHARIERLRPS